MSGAYKCLCNDCGRIANFETLDQRNTAHNGEAACVCGGNQLCACEGCMADAEYLLAGGRVQGVTGFLCSLEGWTPEGGLKA